MRVVAQPDTRMHASVDRRVEERLVARSVGHGPHEDEELTVDVATATYKNSIGAAELVGSFKDPNFDPKQRAFYYIRVLEIPTPRWTAYDAVKYKVKMSADVPMKIQERAVSSPIWYNPA